MRTIYRWFVAVTAIGNLLLGLALVVLAKTPAMLDSASWPSSWVSGGFLAFTAAALFWASFDIERRAPVIFYEGLLRLWAAFTFTQAMDNPKAMGVILSDGLIGLAYLAGLLLIVRVPLRVAAGGSSAQG